MNRKMLFQQFGYMFDTVQGASLVCASLECGFHRVADRFPLVARHPGVNTAVGNDFDGPVCKQNVDQNAIIVFRVPDPKR